MAASALTTIRIGGKDVVAIPAQDANGNAVYVPLDVLAHLDPLGNPVLVTAADRLPARSVDETPGYDPQASGTDLQAGAAQTLLSAGPDGRLALITHSGKQSAADDAPDAVGVLWINCSGTAAPGIGEMVKPGLQWYFPTPNPVSVFYQGTGVVRVAVVNALPL